MTNEPCNESGFYMYIYWNRTLVYSWLGLLFVTG